MNIEHKKNIENVIFTENSEHENLENKHWTLNIEHWNVEYEKNLLWILNIEPKRGKFYIEHYILNSKSISLNLENEALHIDPWAWIIEYLILIINQ